MRPPRRWSAAAWTALGGCSLPACVDLFHSTSDVRTACEIDASACAADAGPTGTGGAPSVCADAGVALQNATHACAWLGACLSPMGNNAFGPCVFQALLAFDCAANPNHLAGATVSATWACLAGAQSCATVQSCIFPGAVPSCSNKNTMACAAGPASDPGATALRIECSTSGQMLGGEDCALWGETCIQDGGSASCGTNLEGACDGSISDHCTGADDSQVIWCGPDGGSSGIDCTANSAGRCSQFPASQPLWVSCLPDTNGDEPDASCPASLNVTCDSGVARSCPTGVPETIDCAALLHSPGACNNGSSLNPPFDWTSPCVLNAQCGADTCDGSVLTSCARGAAFSVDCSAEQQSGACQFVSTDLKTQQHAACVWP